MPENMDSMRKLYVESLRDLFSAETQITQALPQMAQATSSEELKSAFNEHLNQTQEHVARLRDIFGRLGESPEGHECKGMAGLLEEGKEMIEMQGDPEVKDAGLIAAAQRVEHYEIAGYGCSRTFARLLGEDEAADTLQITLEEEAETDERLTTIAEDMINRRALKS